MDYSRINYILNNDEKSDVFYNNKLIWIQGITNNTTATIGFIDNFEEKNVPISDLYEKTNN